MIVTPNMGLIAWDQVNDTFSHQQLAANFIALDSHDHSPGKGKLIQSGGLAPLSVSAANLQDDVLTTEKIAEGAVTTSKLADGSVIPRKLGSFPAVRAIRETVQSIPDATYTALQFTGADRYDTGGLHNPASNSDQFLIVQSGMYAMQGFVSLEGNATGIRNVVISKNTATLPVAGYGLAEHATIGALAPFVGAGGNAINITAVAALDAGDIIRMLVWQNSGGALKTMGGDGVHVAEFGLAFIGPHP